MVSGLGRKEGHVLFNDAQRILCTVIWPQTYGKGPLDSQSFTPVVEHWLER